MKYMGSKARIAKHILPIILKGRKLHQWYVEPFVGGGNIIEKVQGFRLGADNNPYVIEALKLIRDAPESIPDLITEDDYDKAKSERKVDGLTGFIAFSMSFGGKFFGGYRRDVAGTKGCLANMKTQTRRSKKAALIQSKFLKECELVCCSYDDLEIPDKSIIYCDPPYKKTTKYSTEIDYKHFYNWCRNKHNEGHTIFISEYSMPDDFICVWEKELSTTLSTSKSKKPTEKLFTIKR